MKGMVIIMESMKDRLITAMKLRGIRPAELARLTGISKARISQYTHGVYVPKTEGVYALAQALDVSDAWLMGHDVPMSCGVAARGTAAGSVAAIPAADITNTGTPGSHRMPHPTPASIPAPPNVLPLRLIRYPILGEIACGTPIFAEQDQEGGYVTAAETNADFCLIAKGDSMVNARIFDGDEVFIQQTDMVENGRIAAVVVDNEATLKRLYYYPEEERLELRPENPAYQPLTFTGEELNHIHVLGLAVAVQGKLR